MITRLKINVYIREPLAELVIICRCLTGKAAYELHAGTPADAHVQMQQKLPCAYLLFTDKDEWMIAMINIRWVGIAGWEATFQAGGPSRLSFQRLPAANQTLLRSTFNHLTFQVVKSTAANRNHRTNNSLRQLSQERAAEPRPRIAQDAVSSRAGTCFTRHHWRPGCQPVQMSMKQCGLGQTLPMLLSSLVQRRPALPVIVSGYSHIPSID
jgi:hypothetical protein